MAHYCSPWKQFFLWLSHIHSAEQSLAASSFSRRRVGYECSVDVRLPPQYKHKQDNTTQTSNISSCHPSPQSPRSGYTLGAARALVEMMFHHTTTPRTPATTHCLSTPRATSCPQKDSSRHKTEMQWTHVFDPTWSLQYIYRTFSTSRVVVEFDIDGQGNDQALQLVQYNRGSLKRCQLSANCND